MGARAGSSWVNARAPIEPGRSRAPEVVQIALGDWHCPLHSKSQTALHLLCKRLHPHKQCGSDRNPAACVQESRLGYPGERGRAEHERCPGHLPKSQDELSARIVRAQGQQWPTHMHTHGSAGSRVPEAEPRSGAGGSPGVASCRRGGCPRTELEHSLPCGRSSAPAPPQPPPSPSPARGLPRAPGCCRARARACAGQGPSAGGPVEPREASTRQDPD